MEAAMFLQAFAIPPLPDKLIAVFKFLPLVVIENQPLLSFSEKLLAVCQLYNT